MRTGADMRQFKEKISQAKEAMKALELITGRVPQLRQALHDQQTKYNFLAKPNQYYKDFYVAQNSDPAY